MFRFQNTLGTSEDYSIEKLLNMIIQGKIQVPEFQRPFAWTSYDIKALFESIYKEYPIGNILLWKTTNREIQQQTGNKNPLPTKKINYPAYFILDGLQRLSTLYATLIHPSHIKNTDFNIVFDLEKQTFHKDSSENINLPKIRLSDLFSEKEFSILNTKVVNHSNQEVLFPSLMKLNKILIRYTIPVIIVEDSEIQEAAEIFLRINVRGKELKSSDRKRVSTWLKKN